MKEFKGTPGPWIACDHGVGEIVIYAEHDQSAICAFDADGCSFAWPSENYQVSGEAMANARIMAASKNMLEVLLYQRRHQDGDARCDLQTYLHLRDAAIAKALGEDHE